VDELAVIDTLGMHRRMNQTKVRLAQPATT
jgi:hypothetical protein